MMHCKMEASALKFVHRLEPEDRARADFYGVLAALYQPVWTVGITSAEDFALAIAAFLLLFMWRAPPWLVVILSAAAGALIAKF